MASKLRARSKATFLRMAAVFLAVILATTVIAIAAAPGKVLAAGENLLTNPGFEAGDTAWEKWGNPVVTTAEKHSGNQSLPGETKYGRSFPIRGR